MSLFQQRKLLVDSLLRQCSNKCMSERLVKPLNHGVLRTGFRNISSNGQWSDDEVRKMRLMKRVGAGILFSATLGFAIYSKRNKAQRLRDCLEGCERLPPDPDYTSSMGSEFYRCKSCIFPGDVVKSGTLKKLESLELKHNDVIVASFPKSGTTWMQEIVYLIQTGLDFERAKKQVLETRFPYLEHPYPGLAAIKKTEGPRFIKTHLPLSLLPKSALENGTKVIYIVRNPKDVAVSYYYFLRMATFVGYRGGIKDFVNKFIKGDVPYGPYFDHVLGYWKHHQNNSNCGSNLLWITYEDMHRDPEGSIRRVAHFLDRALTDDQVQLIAAHTRFESMAGNPSVNYSHWDDLGLRNKNEAPFMRSGRVGDWRRSFDADTNRRFDDFIRQHLESSELKFDYIPADE
ncbi:sulfotransferase 1E1 [Daphnia magna]|uniref:sulfotransferase 1E1 n=1 Tax=Daphnia magna TaxID=35525 RepID=UPI001E1BC5E2|nr:sulfotransferase 1E1 [Daphnia magna]